MRAAGCCGRIRRYSSVADNNFKILNTEYWHPGTAGYVLVMYRMPKFRDPRMRMHMRISVHEDPRTRMHMRISKNGDPRMQMQMRISVQEDPRMRMQMRIFGILIITTSY